MAATSTKAPRKGTIAWYKLELEKAKVDLIAAEAARERETGTLKMALRAANKGFDRRDTDQHDPIPVALTLIRYALSEKQQKANPRNGWANDSNVKVHVRTASGTEFWIRGFKVQKQQVSGKHRLITPGYYNKGEYYSFFGYPYNGDDMQRLLALALRTPIDKDWTYTGGDSKPTAPVGKAGTGTKAQAPSKAAT